MRDDSNQTRHHIIEFLHPKRRCKKGGKFFCRCWYGRYGRSIFVKGGGCKSFPTYIILYDSQNKILTIFGKVLLFVLMTVVNSFSTRGIFLCSLDVECYTFSTMVSLVVIVIPNFFNL